MAEILKGVPSTVFDGFDIPDNVHLFCENCIAGCRKKYENFSDDTGRLYKDGFAIKCNFIPEDENYISPSLRKALKISQEEFDHLHSIKNPALWIKKNLINPDNGMPWELWDYQKEAVLCSSEKSIWRFGRRTGKSTTLAAMILWFLFTSGGGRKDPKTGKIRQNIKILFIAPMKAQVSEVFGMIRTFLSLSPHLNECVKTNRQGSPEVISLKGPKGGEGNQIKGFASGDSSSSGGRRGLSVRGQGADWIIVDEAAYVSEDVIQLVLKPILATRPDVKITYSSTPSGIPNDHFERTCIRSPGYKEFHVPTTAKPDFEKIKISLATEYGSSADTWEREVMANFAQAGEGVYKDSLIKQASSDYQYAEMMPTPGLLYTFGIDWNKEHGTEIVILGTTKANPHISFVVGSENIPKKDFTTPMGIDRIVALNRYWQPRWIYVDDGGGGDAAVQLFQLIGKQAGRANITDARLLEIVKSFNFSSNVEVRDATGQMVKKPAKPFMVDFSVRKFELGELKFSRHDMLLQKQLENYVVIRRTISGVPVYGLKEPKWGDHRLDAMNLALMAVRLELPSLCDESIMILPGQMRVIQNPLSKQEGQRSLGPAIIDRSLTSSISRTKIKNPIGNTFGRGWGPPPSDKEREKMEGKRSFYTGKRTWR